RSGPGEESLPVGDRVPLRLAFGRPDLRRGARSPGGGALTVAKSHPRGHGDRRVLLPGRRVAGAVQPGAGSSLARRRGPLGRLLPDDDPRPHVWVPGVGQQDGRPPVGRPRARPSFVHRAPGGAVLERHGPLESALENTVATSRTNRPVALVTGASAGIG